MHLMHHIIALLLIAGLLCAPDRVLAQDSAQQEMKPQDIYGLWLTENERSVIELLPCADDPLLLCGKIAWIIDGGLQFDKKNPSMDLRKRPLCGLTILKDFENDSDSPYKWDNGSIYKADEGDIYSAKLKLKKDGSLYLRGYVGIPLLGKSQIWHRVSPDDYARCKPAKAE